MIVEVQFHDGTWEEFDGTVSYEQLYVLIRASNRETRIPWVAIRKVTQK